MKDSRLLEIFQNLDKKELRDLGKFVRSPFHNQRKDVIDLFSYLLKWTKNPNLAVSKVAVFPILFPDEPFDEKKIRYTMSFLYQAIKNFLAVKALESDAVGHQLAVVSAFRQKGLERLFGQEFRIAEKMLQQQPFRHQHFYLQNYHLQNEKYRFTMTQTRGQVAGLAEMSDAMDTFFIANKLQMNAHGVIHKAMHQSEFQPHLMEEILEHLSVKGGKEQPAIAVYYHCLKMLTTDESLPHFQALRRLIDKSGTAFPSEELKDIYTFALNYCIKRLNAREDFFHREAFELYKKGLEQGIFINNKMMSRFDYKNIVALGLGLKEWDWVEQFIEDYQFFLEKKYRRGTHAFNLALLYYKRGDYAKAMVLLQQVGTSDVLNNLNARRMLVRIYYDLKEFEALYSLLDSFQNYIYRKKELGYHRELYLNFIKFTRKLLQIEGYTKEQVTILRQQVANTKNVAEKDWLLDQIA